MRDQNLSAIDHLWHIELMMLLYCKYIDIPKEYDPVWARTT